MNNYITTYNYFEFANVERSILQYRGHIDAMTKSRHHARVMMGEIDEPVDLPEYDAINSAGFFGIITAMTVLNTAAHDEEVDPCLVEAATGVAIQLLFGLLTNDEDMAGLARWMRTGFIGTPSQTDKDHVPALKKYFRKITRLSESFISNAVAGKWEKNLLNGSGTPVPIEVIVTLEPYED